VKSKRTPTIVYSWAAMAIVVLVFATAAKGDVPDGSAFLPADRATFGARPVRSTVCATLTPRGGELDDTARIQAVTNSCPAGPGVQLAAGTFIVADHRARPCGACHHDLDECRW